MYRGYYSPPRYGMSSQNFQRFPEDIQIVVESNYSDRGNIFVSNLQAAENHRTMSKHNIRAILSCAKGYQISHPKQLVPQYLYIPAEDRPSYDLTPYFQQCVDFIKDNIQHHNVLVHCMAGISRSVSMVLAYLMRQYKMTYDQAFYAVKNKRSIINPNEGFIAQLKAYQNRIRRSNSKFQKKQKLQHSRRKSMYASSSQLNYFNSFSSNKKTARENLNKTIDVPYKFQENPRQLVKMHYSNNKQNLSINPEAQIIPQLNAQYGQIYAQIQSKVQKIRSKYDIQRKQMASARRNSLGAVKYTQAPLRRPLFNNSYNKYENSNIFMGQPKSSQKYYPSRVVYHNRNYHNNYGSYSHAFNRPFY